MGSFAVTLIDTVVQPTKAFQRLREKPMVVSAFLIMIAMWAINAWTSTSDPQAFFQELQSTMDPEAWYFLESSGWLEHLIILNDPVVSFWLSIAVFLPFILISTLVVLAVGRAMGGTGTYASMLSIYGFSQIISAFSIVVTYLASGVNPILGVIGPLGIIVWTITLAVLGAREGLALTTGKAIVTLLLSAVIMMVGVFVLTFILLIIFGTMGALTLSGL